MPTAQRQAWINHLEALGDAARRLDYGEVFHHEDHCEARLDAYSFLEGCLFVRTKGTDEFGPKSIPEYTWKCCYHGDKTANKRGLESKVVFDEQGKLTTKRQRDTTHHRRGCEVGYSISFQLVKRGSYERHWVGKWLETTHTGHEFPLNPFTWSDHRASVPEWQQIRAAAFRYRSTNQPYSEASKLLHAELLGFKMSGKDYYNLIRKPLDQEDDNTLAVFMRELTEEGFKTRYHHTDIYNDEDVLTHKQITSIFFYSSQGATLARRFCGGHILQLDATFNSNKNRMPILVAVGITNEGTTFPVAFCFIPAEAEDVFTFFFECLHSEVFPDLMPKVILSDQAKGILIAEKQGALSPCYLQLCQWHVVQAMLKKYRGCGHYTAAEISRVYAHWEDQQDPRVATLQTLTWRYAQSSSLLQLNANRGHLKAKLRPTEYKYLAGIQVKEKQFVTYYNYQRPNLGCEATLRSEGWHRVVHKVIHGQLSLTESAKRLAVKCNDIYSRLKIDERASKHRNPTSLPFNGFDDLKGKVSLMALAKIEAEWLTAQTRLQANEQLDEDCNTYAIFQQYSLPCHHQLSRSIRQGTQIPLNLIHPRWHLFGPPITAEWYPGQIRPTLLISPQRRNPHTALHDLQRRREALPIEQRAAYDWTLKRNLTAIGQAMNELEEGAVLPTVMPPITPRRKARPKKNKKQDTRELTALEAAVQAERQAQRQQHQLQRDSEVLEHRRYEIYSGEVGSHITTTAPPPPAAPESTVSERSPSPVHDELPPSTAPARLVAQPVQTGRPVRNRKRTTRKQESVAGGFTKDSQEGGI